MASPLGLPFVICDLLGRPPASNIRDLTIQNP